MITIGQWWMWLGFLAFVAIMIAADLFLLGGRKAHQVSTKEALTWTGVWFFLALLFNFFLWLYLFQTSSAAIANQKALEFFTGYLIEKSLSVDNIFLILMIFSYFAIPAEYQRRVLLYGVLGAIIMRLILILLGVWVINNFHWILYIFGAFLVVVGMKMFFFAEHEPDLAKNPILRWMRTHLRITDHLQGEKFFVKQNSLLYFTPLFVALILVEITDLIFAVDSIPAIFAITNDPFIVFTSNIFAILGLRALYFLLAKMNHHFPLLKYGLAAILIFIGVKLLIAAWFKVPVLLALGVVIAILTTCVSLDLYRQKQETR